MEVMKEGTVTAPDGWAVECRYYPADFEDPIRPHARWHQMVARVTLPDGRKYDFQRFQPHLYHESMAKARLIGVCQQAVNGLVDAFHMGKL